MKTITEGQAKITTPVEKIVSKKMPVFYNPKKEFDRTLSIFFAKSIFNREFRFLDLFSAF